MVVVLILVPLFTSRVLRCVVVVKFYEKAPGLSDDEIASYALDVYWKFIAYDAPLEVSVSVIFIGNIITFSHG